MYKMKLLAAGAAIVAAAASGAYADSMPKGAQPTDPNKIWHMYAGKTSNWNSGGFAYWATDGGLQATGPTGKSVGVGKWYVTTASKLCQEATYYWLENGARKSDAGTWCWQFVTAPDGTVWEKYLPKNTKWYPHDANKQVKGHTHQRQYETLLRKVGL